MNLLPPINPVTVSPSPRILRVSFLSAVVSVSCRDNVLLVIYIAAPLHLLDVRCGV